jgi:hypothetical protein
VAVANATAVRGVRVDEMGSEGFVLNSDASDESMAQCLASQLLLINLRETV